MDRLLARAAQYGAVVFRSGPRRYFFNRNGTETWIVLP